MIFTQAKKVLLFVVSSIYSILLIGAFFFWKQPDGTPRLLPDEPFSYLLFLPLAVFIIVISIVSKDNDHGAKKAWDRYWWMRGLGAAFAFGLLALLLVIFVLFDLLLPA